ncbi:MAG: polyketide synthase dehydratase domain-containing protein, partial [Acutalibacteraceae bacterium]|nr:polyketide synthase dehydratase domain-containing protein [Acutalibacteraceae bacterium]
MKDLIKAICEETTEIKTQVVNPVNRDTVKEEAFFIIRNIISESLKIPIEFVENGKKIEEYGLDSIQNQSLIKNMEKIFHSLPKTLFYEYETIDDLVHFLIGNDKYYNIIKNSIEKKQSSETSIKSNVILNQIIKDNKIEQSNQNDNNFDSVKENIFSLIAKSDVDGLEYEALLDGDAFYFRDHIMSNSALFPGVAYLELVRQAVERTYDKKMQNDITVTFRNIGWMNPIVCESGQQKKVYISFEKTGQQEFDFIVYTVEQNGIKSIKCQGIVEFSGYNEINRKELKQIKDDAKLQANTIIEANRFYNNCHKLGMLYGESFKYLQNLYVSDEFVFSELKITPGQKMDLFTMIPGMLDGALQSVIGFTFMQGAEDYSEIKVPFGIDKVVVHHPCSSRMWAIARKGDSVGKVDKYDLELLDDNGVLCVEMCGCVSIALPKDTEGKGVLLRKKQVAVEYLADVQSKNDHVDLCIGINNVPEGALEPVKARGNSTIDEWFKTALLAVVEKTKEMIHSKYEKERNLQVVIPNEGEDLLLRAIGALFQTATKENPLFRGKVIEMSKTESK